MICSNCGKEIMEGATYCLECGAPIEEPVVLSELKPKNMEEAAAGGIIKEKGNIKNSINTTMAYEGPFLDFSGYVKSLGNNTSALVGLLAMVLVYLSPFFSWMWTEHFEVKKSANLFEIGGKNGDFAVGSGILIVMAILIMLSAIDMLAFSGCRYVGPIKGFEKNYVVRALPIVLTIIFFFVIINNNNYEMALESIKNQEESTKLLGSAVNFSGGMGVGPIMLIVGIVLYGISILLDYAKGKK